MGDALNLIYYCFSKFLVLFFDTFELFSNVTIGWVLVSIFILGIMISNILSVAKNSISTSITKEEVNVYGQTQLTNRITGKSRLK